MAEQLALEKEKFNFIKAQLKEEESFREKLINRAIDFEYLKLAVILILLIVVLYFLTCGFGFGRPGSKGGLFQWRMKDKSQAAAAKAGSDSSATSPASSSSVPNPSAGSALADVTPTSTPAPAPAKEYFSPYASILSPDISRSDFNYFEARNVPYKDIDAGFIPVSIGGKDFNNDWQRHSSEVKLFTQLHETAVI